MTCGIIKIKNSFIIEEFDEDEGWKEVNIPAGTYQYRIRDINGWMPQQLLVEGKWKDLAGQCEEVNDLMGE